MKNGFKSYMFKCAIVGVLFLLGVLAACVWLDIIQALVVLFVLLLVLTLLVRIFANQSFLPILTQELNAELFAYEIYAKKFLIVPEPFRILAAINTGDYQTVVNLCVKGMARARSEKQKLVYFATLARVYFELDDMENLLMVCEDFYDYVDQSGNAEKLKSSFPLMPYYRCYANGDYEECIAFCKKREGQTSSRIAEINLLFMYAKAHYRLGETEMAAQYYESVASQAPGVYLAKISEQYLATISHGGEVRFETVMPNDADDSVGDTYDSRRNQLKTVRLVLLVAGLLLLILSLVFAGLGEK